MEDDGRWAVVDGRRHYVAVAAVVAVALVLGSGVFVQEFYLSNTTTAVQPNVQAGADVSTDPPNGTGEPGTVTVSWTSVGPTPDDEGSGEDRGSGYLEVHWAAANGTGVDDEAALGHGEDAVAVTDGTWRLAEVGHSVTLTERNATTATAVRVVVTAVRGETRTVIVARDVTL